jgi:hypothetical protein
MSVFERNRMGGLDYFCLAYDKSEWRVRLYIVISSRVHKQHCWNIDWVNIVFTFVYAVFYNCHHPLGFLKDKEFVDYLSSHNRVRINCSPWRLFVIHIFKLFMQKPQTNGYYHFHAV